MTDELLIRLIQRADALQAAQEALKVAVRHERDESYAAYLADEVGDILAEAYEGAHADVVRRRREIEGPFAA